MIRRIVAFGVATVVSIMAAGCQGPAATSETQANADDVATVETQEAGALGTRIVIDVDAQGVGGITGVDRRARPDVVVE